MIESTVKAQATKSGGVERNLTTHSTEARVSLFFIRKDWMLDALNARSVNSGVIRRAMR